MRFYPTRLHKGMVVGFIITFAIFLLCMFLFGCSQKVQHHHGSVDDRLREVRYYDGCNWVIKYPNGMEGRTSLGCSNIDSLNIKIKN